MLTDMIVISGFLGAGKTTLIDKLLRDAFAGKRVALVENDFGEVSVDAALLRRSGMEVREISAGCICCTLSGDFVQSLLELLDRFRPDVVIIEPSGVGKLSDIEKACADARITRLAKLSAKITVVDVKRCRMYRENFGEFFEDQIRCADAIVLSRTEKFPEKVSSARACISEINPSARVYGQAWDALPLAEVLAARVQSRECDTHECSCGHVHDHHEGTCCGHHDHEHHHDADCTCGHHDHGHSAEEAFDTVTVRTERLFEEKTLHALLNRLQDGSMGTVLRAKGLVRDKAGASCFQLVPGEIQITPTPAGDSVITVIGTQLDARAIRMLFDGEPL